MSERNLRTFEKRVDALAEAAMQNAAVQERYACVQLLLGLHQAQSANTGHNYYLMAAQSILQLRGTE